MMDSVRERAFAKLNFTLDVVGKRPDGYHDMETVMQAVGLWDEVDITLKGEPGIEVDISWDDLPKDLHNLAGKAAREYLNYVNMTDIGVEVYITKAIPDRAGLAGGSSDAAAVIRGLDRLLGRGLSEEELLKICAGVGSDVPFCLRGGTQLAAGRGEILTRLAPCPECGIAIVKPGFSVSTPELFAALDGLKIGKRPDTARFISALGRGDIAAASPLAFNVFEQALPGAERRTVEAVKGALLDAGALGAAMTGTGSAVFGIFRDAGQARRADLAGYGDVFFADPLKFGE